MKVNEITSQNNCQIKLLRKLAQKKYRRQNSKFTVENLAIIYDVLNSGFDFTALFLTQGFIDKHKEKFEYIQNKTKLSECYLIDEDLNKSYSQLDTPSGITAVYEKIPSVFNDSRSVVYLNGIKDPGNIGTIMRTALAFDALNIVLSPTCVDIYNFKAISAARDSIFKLNIIEDHDGNWLNSIKGKIPIFVANSNDGVCLSEVKREGVFCLVLGSESHGVGDNMVKIADKSIKIEISNAIESLNVSSAAAILLYGLSR
ncbi:MAG: RNA methyltransferase [Candidatus Omnitrophica bacterium]|nr:RNA methyltransferase [Candidatus Omnitrophota bacterium]MBU1997029.1 RNA methyltransferase [Candidatus Omnitrophota bacterium]MBU4333626.1 RNA methyltransferase [Candidatus Omnitrophota bacterium]